MCDIDYFKCINDTYGHLCGDEMLKCFASIIDEKAAQESGWTGRYGGEEFICLIPDKNADETYKIADVIFCLLIVACQKFILFHILDINFSLDYNFYVIRR